MGSLGVGVEVEVLSFLPVIGQKLKPDGYVVIGRLYVCVPWSKVDVRMGCCPSC